MPTTVIMKFRGSEGLPTRFEIVPGLDDIIQWEGEEYATPGAYLVSGISFGYNALSNSYCPVLWLEPAEQEFREE
ncbi:MAG: hypothetical protein JWN59_39 [Sphingomonas bacterium]|jgi:hypothetical protein|nr:hypothetical protein [Sphingomonas bacterium]MDB5683183.1 hypothetical protein [Sphingomonas bacterium]